LRKVEKFAGGWVLSPTEYNHRRRERLALNAWHQDQVTELAQGAKVVAHPDFCANAALLYDDQIWTIQPHPSLRKIFIRRADPHPRQGRGTRTPSFESASALLGASTDNAKIADHIADFPQRKRDYDVRLA